MSATNEGLSLALPVGHRGKTGGDDTTTIYHNAALEAEVEAARARVVLGHGPMASAHEGYAVILEELDELWEEVRRHRSPANIAAMRDEAVQVAAMALAFIVEVCDKETTC